MSELQHQSQLAPEDNKFHQGNGDDGKHYWLTPPALLAELDAEFGPFDFDPCPFPKPDFFDGLTAEWGQRNYVNPPFGSVMHEGKKKGPTAWVRKAILEWQKGKLVVLVFPIDKWVLMLMKAILGEHADVRNLGDVKWLATEDGSTGKGTGRHIACFILRPAVIQGDGKREAAQGEAGAKLGMHWLESAHLRVAAGEPEAEVLEDFGYVKAAGVPVCATGPSYRLECVRAEGEKCHEPNDCTNSKCWTQARASGVALLNGGQQ